MGAVRRVGSGLLAALTCLALASVAAPAAAVEAAGIRLEPTDPTVLGAESTLRPPLPPGTTATYDMTIRNTRDQPVEVLLYGADVVDGTVTAGTDNTGLGTWIRPASTRLTLEAQGTATVDVDIVRPADDTAGGTAAVIAQLSRDTREELGLDTVQRAAILVIVATDGTGSGVSLAVEPGEAAPGLLGSTLPVAVTATNLGTEAAAFDGRLAVQRTVFPDDDYEVSGELLPPGDVRTINVEVDVPWFGLFGQLQATAGQLGVTTESAPVRVAAPPSPALVFILLALAAAATVYVRRSPMELPGLAALAGVLDRLRGSAPDAADAAPDAARADADDEAEDEAEDGDPAG